MTSKFRVIPSIGQIRERERIRQLEASYGGSATVATLREVAADVRRELRTTSLAFDSVEQAALAIEERATVALAERLSPSLRPLINATGVIIHTNLGRAPLGTRAVDAITSVAAGYCNLEFDTARGERGHRSVHAGSLLCRLTGAERAIVTNNNAAAVLLSLSALAHGREVIVSRGELVEIGGGFRIPDILRQSGATLREVGTTNRTRPEDYAAAISDRTAAILRVHPSNFRIEGFSERPRLEAVTAIGQRFHVPVIDDLGSGNLYDTYDGLEAQPLTGEPTVRQTLETGVTVCCVSGDKLLGGPQAGIILGRTAALEAISIHPLMRAVRADKLVYAALEATLIDHLIGRATEDVPVIRMLSVDLVTLRARATAIASAVTGASSVTVRTRDGVSTIGGGTTPGITLPTIRLQIDLEGSTPDETAGYLRASSPPVIGKIEHDQLLLDLRTVAPHEDRSLIRIIRGLSPSESK